MCAVHAGTSGPALKREMGLLALLLSSCGENGECMNAAVIQMFVLAARHEVGLYSN